MPVNILPFLAGAASFAAPLIGQNKANKENRESEERQREWNENMLQDQRRYELEQWHRQGHREKAYWQMQNRYNERQRDNDRAYGEAQRDYQNQWNLDMWHRQNKYNSPIEQMARLKEAGLNPHLMYGKGTVGQAGQLSSTQAKTEGNRGGTINSNGYKSPDVKGYSRAEMKSVTAGMDAFGSYQSMKNLQAQTNNTEAITDIHHQEAINKAQDSLLKAIDIKHKSLKYGIAKELRTTSVDAAKANLEYLQSNLRKKTAEADITIGTKDARIRRAYAEVKHLMKSTKGKELEIKLKHLEYKLRKEGISNSDNVLLRMLIQSAPEGNGSIIQKLGESFIK